MWAQPGLVTVGVAGTCAYLADTLRAYIRTETNLSRITKVD